MTDVYESTEQPNVNQAEEVTTAQASSNDERKFTQADVIRAVNERLKNKEEEVKRKEEKTQNEIKELTKRIDELQKKETQGTATDSDRIELEKGKQSVGQSVQQGVPPEVIAQLANEKMSKEKFFQKIQTAAEKDAGFKNMVMEQRALPDDQRAVTEDQLFFLRDLDNAPQVLKKLLSDKRKNEVMKAKFTTMLLNRDPSVMVEFIQGLSEQLEESANKPRASSYSPNPDISDFGESTQDWDVKDAVRRRLSGKK